MLRSPKRAEVDRWVAGLPTAEEALDRRMQDDSVQVGDLEQAVSAHSGVL
jgi:hypothetical protein